MSYTPVVLRYALKLSVIRWLCKSFSNKVEDKNPNVKHTNARVSEKKEARQ